MGGAANYAFPHCLLAIALRLQDNQLFAIIVIFVACRDFRTAVGKGGEMRWTGGREAKL